MLVQPELAGAIVDIGGTVESVVSDSLDFARVGELVMVALYTGCQLGDEDVTDLGGLATD